MNLETFFKSIPDFRRGQGQRFELPPLLWMIFLGIASGYKGYRPIARFARAHNEFFMDAFKLRHPVPSHVTFRKILTGLDKEELVGKFNAWAAGEDPQPLEWMSGDGKSLRSTCSGVPEAAQDFAASVSLYCHRTGLSLRMAHYRNKKTGEGEVLRGLLASLKDKGVIISLDALHTQKKR